MALMSGFSLDVRNNDHLFYGWHRFHNLLHVGKHVKGLVLIEVAVHGKEYLRLYLAETVDHCLHAQFGAAGRPGGADACCWQAWRSPSLSCWACMPRPCPPFSLPVRRRLARRPTVLIEFFIGHANSGLCLALEGKGNLFVPVPEEVFGKIEFCPGKPLCPGNFFKIVHHLIILSGCLDLQEIPHVCPEIRDTVHRPVVEIEISCELLIVPLIDKLDEPVMFAFLILSSDGCPQRLLHVLPPGN